MREGMAGFPYIQRASTKIKTLSESKTYLWIKWAGVLIILSFLMRVLMNGWDQQRETFRNIDIPRFIVSVLILSGAFSLLPLASKRTATLFNREISIWKSYQAYFFAQIGKYLPGGIWSYVGRVYLLQQRGIEKEIALYMTLLELFFLTLSGYFCFLLSAYFWDQMPLFISVLFWGGVFVMGVFLFLPFFHKRITPFFVRSGIDGREGDRFKEISAIILLYSCFWGMVGFGFYWMTAALVSIPLKMSLILLGLYPMAWILANFFFFIPAGIGIREGALIYLLNFYLTPQQSIGVSLISRFWWILAEFICAGLVLIGHYSNKGKE